MNLYYKGTDKLVNVGDEVTSFRGEKYIVHYFREPNHGEGKVSVKKNVNDDLCCGEYYVSVFGLEWR